MKVFFIQDTLINAGTEKSLLQILPLVSPEIEFKVVYFYPRHDLKDAYERAGIPLVFLDLEGKYDFWKGIKKLRELIQKGKPDILVSSLLRSNLITRMASLLTGVPLVGTFVNDSYNNYRLEIKKGIQRQKFKFFWGLDRITAAIPKLYISNSSFIAKSHIKTLGVPLEKTKVVYRGRNIPSQIWKKRVSDTFEFISYGRLLQIKGFQELIQAFAKVHSVYPNSRLMIYGEGIHRPVLEKLVKELDLSHSVSLPGVISNVTEIIYKADCFVFPSWYEGFSGALVEAMMAGIPIIASDIPMNLEALTPDVNAITFPVRDVNALTRKMEYAVTHQQEMAELGRKAREEACGRFDIQLIAKQYESVLREAYQKYAAT
ncbi:glycosyltransferase involved in cell wall biosynthesis [Algoriphagus iocasae]|uniref:Glycosyltransferase involved in cell wall biosynthesis n=1 Tax=Algoriphagus iocasae TaxID=1836499 RepID=A0A841MUQ5_9BACT|nr:glycosyltransferase family 4 protein [Algoriphagus iocasae]MBB6327826.1 glycosyltransferase involved in cell wall biosynthesis [Algoriphagus iocasae]